MRQGAWIVATAVLMAAVVALTLTQRRPNDRFGDPAVLEQIKTMNCGELRQWADSVLRLPPDHTDEDFDKAVGYSNAANDRMDELGCFQR